MSGRQAGERPAPMAPRLCAWCGRLTSDLVVQVADDHGPEVWWCREAEPCQQRHADREARRRTT